MEYQLDLLAGREARDEGMAAVDEPTLTERLEEWLTCCVGTELTGEDVRVRSGLIAHHHNSWGAAINALVRKGVLEKTGTYRQMQLITSHARVNPVYRVVSP